MKADAETLNVTEPRPPGTNAGSSESTRVAFRFHARALAALGRDLVTNDVVAVMELVKNAYDALATRVDVRIRAADGASDESFIEIVDDGHGMDYATIRDVWFMIATPFRQKRPVLKMGARSRAVTGEKGLGRLSAARLGRDLRVVTRTAGGPGDWDWATGSAQAVHRERRTFDGRPESRNSVRCSHRARRGPVVRGEDQCPPNSRSPFYGVPSRNPVSRDSRACGFVVSHCQTTMTLQPSSRRAFRLARSRSTFFRNLSFQNDVRVAGVVVRRHPSWRCQKQPWTKIAFLRPGKQMSGVPGRLRR